MLMVKNLSPGFPPELEVLVLDTIKGLQKKHIPFQLNSKFIEYCSQKLKISELDIYKVIYSLLHHKIIVPGSTLTQNEILINSNRAIIYETIQNNPGIHIRELYTKIGLSSGVIRSHLLVLENFAFIRRKKYETPKFVLLFPKDYHETYDDYFVILKNDNDQRIVQLLLKNPLSLTELSSQLNLHHSTVQYHLEKLESLNIITRIIDNNITKFDFNQERIESFLTFLNSIYQ